MVPLLTNENQLLQQEVEMDATEPLHDDSIGNRRKRWTSAVASKSSVDLMSLLQSQLQHSRETRAADKAGRLPADEVFVSSVVEMGVVVLQRKEHHTEQ